jgi:photosystem II stability/assembly factor-like uncharacterized protein
MRLRALRSPKLALAALSALAALAPVAGAAVLSLCPAPLAAQPVPERLYQEMHWRSIGPFRGGRTRAVAGVSGDPATLYIGVCDGGVWRSLDYGRTWTPIFDDQPTQSIGAIAVAPSDPRRLYVATGEGLQRPDLSVGNGVYRSDDGGETWENTGIEDGQQIPALAVDPGNPDRVFAAVLGHPYGPNEERGVFRTTDGGATWERVLFLDADTGAYDVDVDPAHPQVVYATFWQGRQGPWEYGNAYGGGNGGIFKSTDGGDTWEKLAGGLPETITSANLAIAPSRPDRLCALLATTLSSGYQSGEGQGLYRSDDAGATWESVTDDPRPLMRIGGGDLPMVGVDPQDPDTVYSTAIVTVRSTDGGKTWVSLRGAPGGDDYQNVWVDPEDSSVILLAADQGAVVSVDGGATWSSWYNQPTAQLYHVQASHDFPYRVCSGQQESGSVCIASRGDSGAITFRDWRPVGVIEYGYVAPDPLDPDVVYGAGRNVVTKYRYSTGQTQSVTPIPVLGDDYRVDRTQPILFSPADPHVLYYAANVVFETRDGGATWKQISPDLAPAAPGIPASLGTLADDDPAAPKKRGVVYALGPSFLATNTLWAGTDEGHVHVTRDGGKTWTDVTPDGLAPWSKVTQIEASHFDEGSAYASVSRLRTDDLAPYVYRTHDGGASWRLVASGLPAGAPVDTVREDPVRKGLLYAGTETGVWVTFDDGDQWQSLQLDLPHSSMRDLWIHDDDLIVATHGRGFWILDDLAPLRQASAEVAGAAAHLFEPTPAVRVRRSLYTDTPLPADEPMGENPPAGAVIDYALGAAADGPVSLEILDGAGALVRRYASTDEPELSEAELAIQMIPTYWVRPFRALPATPGMHRWVWDLRYAPPEVAERGYPISAVPHDTPRVPEGPLVVPGTYTVRLTASGQATTAPLEVTMDPRVETSAEGLARQLELERMLAARVSEATQAAGSARAVHEQLAELAGKAKGSLARDLEALDRRVKAVLEGAEAESATPASPGLESLGGRAGSLYDDVGQADVAPTAAQSEAAAQVDRDLGAALERWQALAAELPPLNRKLQSRGLAPVDPEARPMGTAPRRNEE